MMVTEEYLDELLGRDFIALAGLDTDMLEGLGFGPVTVSEDGKEVTDTMLRCPCDDGYRWRFYIAISEFPDGTLLMGFRDGMMTLPGWEYRQFTDMAKMSRFNAGTAVYDWMISMLRTMLECDAIEPELEQGSSLKEAKE